MNNWLQKLKGKDNYLTTGMIAVGIVVLIMLIVMIYLFFSSSTPKPTTNNVKDIPVVTSALAQSPTPTPIPLPKGPREFGVSTQANPGLRGLKFDEYDPAVGQNQTITVTAVDNKGKITSIDVTVISDHKQTVLPMKLSSGTETDGVWTATYKPTDTHDYIYSMVIVAKNDKGDTSTVKPVFR